MLTPGASTPAKVNLRNTFGATINPATDESVTNVATTIADGRKTVASAGTAEKLVAGVIAAKKVIIMALETNNNAVVVGASTVVANAGTRRGIALLPFASVEFTIDDVSKIYIDAVTNGEGVSFVYLV